MNASLFQHRPLLMAEVDDPDFLAAARRWATQAADDLRDHTLTSRSEYTTQSVTNWMPALCQYVIDLAAIVENVGWQTPLVAIAEAGIQVSLTYSPTEDWPNEADEKPVSKRWQAWATTVPGTDMCQYVYYGESPGEALLQLYAALYPQEATE